MARRRMSSRRRPKKPVFWDSLDVPIGNLPAGTIAAAASRDGAFSSVVRYGTPTAKIGGDLTIKRTILQCTTQGDMNMVTTADNGFVMELCIGLSIFDSMQDADGVAINTTLVDGTGPITDVDNSRWYARCCVQIPFGALRGAGLFNAIGFVLPFVSARDYARGYVVVQESSTANIMDWTWYCEIDSKSQRKMEGVETENVQFCVEARANKALGTGNSFGWSADLLSGRHLLSRRG